MANLRGIPAQYTTDITIASKSQIAALERALKITAADFVGRKEDPEDSLEYRLLREIYSRKSGLEAERARRADVFRRLDNLYHARDMTLGGADHWSDDPATRLAGKAHVSVNVHAAFVDIPASLQATRPIINYVPTGPAKDEREANQRREALFFRWWDDNDLDLELENMAQIKALYGDTAVKVYWDEAKGLPSLTVIENPEQLYLGFGTSDYRRIDWALYCYGMSPQAVKEDWGLDVKVGKDGEEKFPIVYNGGGDHADPLQTLNSLGYQGDTARDVNRRQSDYEDVQVEVYDYWYKKPTKPGRMPEIWNAIYIGNYMVKNERHREFDTVPYVWLRNTTIPGSPYGKPELYDVEQLLREKDERITNAAQMIQSIVGGQMWQLIGPEAPDEVSANVIPKPNKVATPGPGNEIRVIQPFIPQFAVEDYLQRIDREIAVVTGLNDLLLGLAPGQVLSSSKAISALVANYEARIGPKRKLLYSALKEIWRLTAQVWERKNRDIRELIDGEYRIEIKAPELTPRDELEVAQMAINLVQNRIWAGERAMDRTGVEDPVDEKTLIREEQTDAALNPAAVQAMAQLMAVLQQLGMQAPPEAQQAVQAQQQNLNNQRVLNPPAAGGQSLNAPENAGNAAPEAMPANAEGGLLAQTMLQGGEASGRVLSQQKL